MGTQSPESPEKGSGFARWGVKWEVDSWAGGGSGWELSADAAWMGRLWTWLIHCEIWLRGKTTADLVSRTIHSLSLKDGRSAFARHAASLPDSSELHEHDRSLLGQCLMVSSNCWDCCMRQFSVQNHQIENVQSKKSVHWFYAASKFITSYEISRNFDNRHMGFPVIGNTDVSE